VSEIETCVNGHSGISLFTRVPSGARYCKKCSAIRQGARRAKAGLVKKSKYDGAYDSIVLKRIANLEAKMEAIQKEILIQKQRLNTD